LDAQTYQLQTSMGKVIRELLLCRGRFFPKPHSASPFSYVVLTFGQQRVKTPSIKRTLNPKYLPKDATFELPIYTSEIERHGAFLDFAVWDKDIIGKGALARWSISTSSSCSSKLDYLAELSLTLNHWYRRKLDNGNSSGMIFDDPANNVSQLSNRIESDAGHVR
jgi:C2 domain